MLDFRLNLDRSGNGYLVVVASRISKVHYFYVFKVSSTSISVEEETEGSHFHPPLMVLRVALLQDELRLSLECFVQQEREKG